MVTSHFGILGIVVLLGSGSLCEPPFTRCSHGLRFGSMEWSSVKGGVIYQSA